MAQLEQTKGTFKAVGIVNRLAGDNAYNEGTLERGRYEGSEFRSLRFGVKTRENNELFVELFGMERECFAYKPPTKEERKAKKKGTTKKIAFEDRDNIPKGYNLIGVTVGLLDEEALDEGKRKVVRETFVEYDAVDEIFNNFEDGDSISVSGDISFRTYENQQGETVLQTQYSIRYASKLPKDVDFEDEKFEETASFEQEIVFVGSDYDKKEKKLYVTGRTIDYKGDFVDVEFVIDPSTEKIKEVFTAFQKKLKFGDFVKIVGLCINEAQEVEDDIVEKPKKDNPFGDGGLTPKGQEKRTLTKRVTELRITGVDIESFVTGKYTDDDFIIEEDEEFEEEEEGMDDNPFASNDDDDEDGDDDLPFE